jgi:Carboxypeptidase regulatory-like domain
MLSIDRPPVRRDRLVRTAGRLRGGLAIAAVGALISLAACSVPAASPGDSSLPGTSATSQPSPSPTAASGLAVSGHAHAGPTCPVQRPGDSACGDRPVAGAVLVVTTTAGTEVTRTTTDATGAFTLDLPAGSYVLVPQAAAGHMGTAQPQPFTVAAGGAAVDLDVSYDTGIR